MTERIPPTLVREDPDREPLVGHVKVTREDWLNIARDVLVHEGVGELKIMTLAERLSVSRSSFYWYFKNRTGLLDALLDEWETRNTGQIVQQCNVASRSINEALSNFFRCFVDRNGFDAGLDFAVREWARRDENVRARIDRADAARLRAVTGMFLRHDFPATEADIRARVVYYMQIGYHALELRENFETRLNRAGGFLEAFTGQAPTSAELEDFARFVHSLQD